jgi:hypothetical protein
MKVAFLSETNYQGKWPVDFPNARTEIAWQIALDADHHNIFGFQDVKGYDHVFLIIPKGKTYLSAEGSRLLTNENPTSNLLSSNLVSTLKQNNKKVYFVQEGPHWWFNDYEIVDQINFYNLLASVDSIFAHNESDVSYYKGMVPHTPVYVMPTLMIEDLIKDIVPTKEDKTIIGGNFARWYGGFESYIIARDFKTPIWGQTSHATRDLENQLVQHLPRVFWVDWIKQLSTFKYAVHLMPTVAAGTFALNCAYLGIPCIGNKLVDTQLLCHPALAVDVSDIETARKHAVALRDDLEFYQMCSKHAKANYEKYYSLEVWKNKVKIILDEKC